MSDQTPPQYPNYPSGDQPTTPAYGTPPPPSAYGNPPPAYGAGQPGPTAAYASWWSRVGAYLLDGLIALGVAIVPLVVGGIILGTTATTTTDADGITQMEGGNPLGYLLVFLGYLLLLGFQIWNSGIRQGKQGQSLGKKIVGIRVVRADNGQFLGAGAGFLRYLMLVILGGICFLDYLWPLWDDKKQAWHDKIVTSVVLRA